MQIDRPIATALLLFIILLLIFFLVFPEYNTFKNLRQELGEKTAEYNAEFQYYGEISATYFKLQAYKDDIAKIDNALPTDSSFGNLVYYFQKTANENGIIVKDLFLSKSSLGGNSANGKKTALSVNDVNFSLDLMGSYSSLESFIVALEKSSRLFEITSISFGAGATAGSSALPSSLSTQSQTQQTYSFNLQVKTHSY